MSPDSSRPISPNLAPSPSSQGGKRPLAAQRRLSADFILGGLTRFGALCILGMLVALLAVLTMAAWPSITTYKTRFLSSSQWRPNALEVPVHDAHGHVVLDADDNVVTKTLPPEFGAWPVIYGTVVSSILALIVRRSA